MVRALEFIFVFLDTVLSGEEDLVKCAHKAYEESLKKYHGWIVRGVFLVSVGKGGEGKEGEGGKEGGREGGRGGVKRRENREDGGKIKLTLVEYVFSETSLLYNTCS